MHQISKVSQKLFCPLVWIPILLILSSSIHGQILDYQKETVWLHERDSVYPDSSYTTEAFIGNHPLLDLSSNQQKAQLKRIASHRSGTLFLVLKVGEGYLPGEKLLQLGRVMLYTDKAILGGKELALDTLDSEASILRLSFQGRSDHRNHPARVYLSDHVQIAEILFYDKVLDKQSARIAESYLAMKYSINITENTDPELRDYVDIFRYKPWNSKLDHLYNEEVLALGRIDRIGFFQSQTYTSDAKSLCVSLDSSSSAPGNMPLLKIDDGSLLIFSKKSHDISNPECGDSPIIHGWKIRLLNWSSEAEKLHLTIDTLLDSNQQPLLTNGNMAIPVVTTIKGEKTMITIPLQGLDTSDDLYLAWNASSEGCDLRAEAELLKCNLIDSSSHRLYVKVDPDYLPATLSLVNLNTREALQTQLKEPMSQVNHLGQGQYQLSVISENHQLLDEVFTLDPCLADNAYDSFELSEMEEEQGSEAGSEETLSSWNFSYIPGNGPDTMNPESLEAYLQSVGFHLNGSDVSERIGISVFPNPGSRLDVVTFRLTGLADISFDIQIFDSRGSLMHQESFRTENYNSDFQYHFRVDGSYFVRFNSAIYSETKHIRIKSNLH